MITRLYNFLKSAALWVMASGTLVALSFGAWASWQYRLIDYPVISLTAIPEIIGAVSPGGSFAVRWQYKKYQHCSGFKVISLYDSDTKTYVRVNAFDANWLVSENSAIEFYTVPKHTPIGRMTLILDVDYWCNFIRHVHQRINTIAVHVTPRVNDGKCPDIP